MAETFQFANSHQFNVGVAQKYGVDEAILIQNLYFWIQKNKANNKHFHDGHYWTYNSAKAFTQLFPYWTERQVSRILTNMEQKGIVISGNYNELKCDRTKWYTLSDEVISIYTNGGMDFTERSNGNNQTVEPIPDSKPDVNTYIKSSCPPPAEPDGVKPKAKNKKTFEHDSNPSRLARLLSVCIQDNKPDATFSEQTLQGWAADIDKLLRLDKANVDDVAEVIQWCQKDDFWKSNILSGAALRKQYLRLSMKALSK